MICDKLYPAREQRTGWNPAARRHDPLAGDAPPDRIVCRGAYPGPTHTRKACDGQLCARQGAPKGGKGRRQSAPKLAWRALRRGIGRRARFREMAAYTNSLALPNYRALRRFRIRAISRIGALVRTPARYRLRPGAPMAPPPAQMPDHFIGPNKML